MIATLWLVLAALVCGGIYAAGRVLARDDMPLSRTRIKFPATMSLPVTEEVMPSAASALSSARDAAGLRVTLPGPNAPGSGGHDRAGESYQLLFAMASALNDAWLDRLFAGTGAE